MLRVSLMAAQQENAPDSTAPEASPDAPKPEWFAGWPPVDSASEPSGWVAILNRSVGVGDSPEYTEATALGVNTLKARAGLPEDGVVDGTTWALFMPEYSLGGVGAEIAQVREHFGLEKGQWFDQELADALGSEELNASAWAGLVGLTLADPPEVEAVETPNSGEEQAANAAGEAEAEAEETPKPETPETVEESAASGEPGKE